MTLNLPAPTLFSSDSITLFRPEYRMKFINFNLQGATHYTVG